MELGALKSSDRQAWYAALRPACWKQCWILSLSLSCDKQWQSKKGRDPERETEILLLF